MSSSGALPAQGVQGAQRVQGAGQGGRGSPGAQRLQACRRKGAGDAGGGLGPITSAAALLGLTHGFVGCHVRERRGGGRYRNKRIVRTAGRGGRRFVRGGHRFLPCEVPHGGRTGPLPRPLVEYGTVTGAPQGCTTACSAGRTGGCGRRAQVEAHVSGPCPCYRLTDRQARRPGRDRQRVPAHGNGCTRVWHVHRTAHSVVFKSGKGPCGAARRS